MKPNSIITLSVTGTGPVCLSFERCISIISYISSEYKNSVDIKTNVWIKFWLIEILVKNVFLRQSLLKWKF